MQSGITYIIIYTHNEPLLKSLCITCVATAQSLGSLHSTLTIYMKAIAAVKRQSLTDFLILKTLHIIITIGTLLLQTYKYLETYIEMCLI
jgi:hypothetical protein